jgi:NitT/TauT family transport system substrate-binding protein
MLIQKRNRWLRPTIALLASAFLLPACGLLTKTGPTPTPAAPDKLKVGIMPYTSYGPFFIAQAEGYYAEQNLDVEYVRFDSGAQMIPSLEQGQIDVAGTGPSVALLNVIATNQDIKIVADKGYLDPSGCTYMAILSSPDFASRNPTPTAEALRGLKISMDPTNFEGFMVDKLLQPTGLTVKDFQVESVSPPALADSMQNGALDLVSIGEPWVTRLLDTQKAVVWQKYQDIVPNMQFGIVVYGKNLLVNHTDLGKRFMTAYLKGVRQYNLGKTDRNVEILATNTKLDPELLKRACWPPMRGDGTINLDTILGFQSWSVQNKSLDKPAATGDLWDPQFELAANKTLGPVK